MKSGVRSRRISARERCVGRLPPGDGRRGCGVGLVNQVDDARRRVSATTIRLARATKRLVSGRTCNSSSRRDVAWGALHREPQGLTHMRLQARSDTNRRITMSNRSSVGSTRSILGAQVRVVLVEGPTVRAQPGCATQGAAEAGQAQCSNARAPPPVGVGARPGSGASRRTSSLPPAPCTCVDSSARY